MVGNGVTNTCKLHKGISSLCNLHVLVTPLPIFLLLFHSLGHEKN